MQELPQSIKAKNITEIAIPGSHNSGTYKLHKSLPVGPDEIELVQKLGNNPVTGKLAKFILKRWGVCQHSDIRDQLKIGIRYFDFRLGKVNDEIRILHGLYGEEISNILKVINEFLEEHMDEVAILDFQKIYQCSKEDHEQIISFIETSFGSKLLRKDNKHNLSLCDLVKNHVQVIVIYDNSWRISNPYLWPRMFCPNPWANTMRIPKLFSFLEGHLSKRSSKSLFVTQGILTPKVKTVLLAPFTTLFQVTKNVNKKLPHWIEDKAFPLKPNIVMTDFVSETQIPALTIGLNFKQP